MIPAALALAALGPGCVRLQYEREMIERLPPLARIEALVPGESGLADALQRLGAPLDVWEGKDGGPVLAYGELRTAEWAFSVSMELTRGGSASFSYDDVAARTQGVILIFGADLGLQLVRSGNLRDLRHESEHHPSAALDDGA